MKRKVQYGREKLCGVIRIYSVRAGVVGRGGRGVFWLLAQGRAAR